jgi:hypothetical protein
MQVMRSRAGAQPGTPKEIVDEIARVQASRADEIADARAPLGSGEGVGPNTRRRRRQLRG